MSSRHRTNQMLALIVALGSLNALSAQVIPFVNNPTGNSTDFGAAVSGRGGTLNTAMNFATASPGALPGNLYAGVGVNLTATGIFSTIVTNAGPEQIGGTPPLSAGEGPHFFSNYLGTPGDYRFFGCFTCTGTLTITFSAPVLAAGLFTIDLYNPSNAHPVTIEAFTGPHGTGVSLGKFSSAPYNFQQNNLYFMGVLSASANIESLVFTDPVDPINGDVLGLTRVEFATPGPAPLPPFPGGGAGQGGPRVEAFNPVGKFRFQFGSGGPGIFGTGATGPGQFAGPLGITGVDSGVSGTILVADTLNSRIQAFDRMGNFRYQFGTLGPGPGQFSLPVGIAAVGDRIVVADNGNSRVQVFDSLGNFVFQFGGFGFGPGQFISPYGIAIGPGPTILVTDSALDNVQVFDMQGNFRFGFGTLGRGPGQFLQPEGIGVMPNGNIAVCDTLNNRVQVFDASGRFLYEIGSFGSGPGQFNFPTGLNVGTNALMHVADTGNARVAVFDSVGRFLYNYGAPGAGPGEFTSPVAITVLSTGNMVVLDSGGFFSPSELLLF